MSATRPAARREKNAFALRYSRRTYCRAQLVRHYELLELSVLRLEIPQARVGLGQRAVHFVRPIEHRLRRAAVLSEELRTATGSPR